MKVALEKPVTFGDEVIHELELEELTAEHIEDLEFAGTRMQLKLGDLITMGLRAAKQPPALKKLLSARDGIALAAAVGSFFGEPESPQGTSGE